MIVFFTPEVHFENLFDYLGAMICGSLLFLLNVEFVVF
jgi:hypothetical protein